MLRENMKISAGESLGQCECKQGKLWFDEECSKFADKGSRRNCSAMLIQII
jgi:hypothetical protein